jgi:hypothetical protein
VDSGRFWGWATLQVLHYIACQLSSALRAHITPTQERVCKLPDIAFQFRKPFDVILNVSTCCVKPISYLSPELHGLTQFHDLLFRNVQAASFWILLQRAFRSSRSVWCRSHHGSFAPEGSAARHGRPSVSTASQTVPRVAGDSGMSLKRSKRRVFPRYAGRFSCELLMRSCRLMVG